MQTEKYININPNKLHNELIAAGINPILVENDCSIGSYTAPNTWITFEDSTDMVKVQQVIEAHDPTPAPPPLTAEERISALETLVLQQAGVI